jgi:HAD superfamily hydrolase (TIGR01509 family)
MKKFKGFIFDFNGVLLRDQHLHDEIFKTIAFDITGRVPTDEEFRNIFHGRSNQCVFEYLLGRAVEPDELENRARAKELAYQELSRKTGGSYRLAPGTTALIKKIRARAIPYTIATSSPRMNVSFYNEMFGLDALFDMGKIVCTEGTLRGKPAPDIYLKAADMLSLKPEDCVVIEDARSGIAAAHAVGIGHIIAIGPKDSHERLRKISGVDEVIERLDEVDVSRLF